MRDILQELRTAWRALGRRPGFTAVAVVTLALGVGAATVIYAVVDAALLRPLPFRDPDRLRMVWGVAGPEHDVRGASPIEIADWRRLTRSFTALSIYDQTTLNISGSGEARQLSAERVSPGFFALLGVAPALGRALTPEDDVAGGTGGVVIGDALWRSRFAADPGVLGRTLRLDDRPFTVVGVMPPGFAGLSFDCEVWTPLGPFRTAEALGDRGSRWLGAVGRLRPGVSPEAAQADLDAAARALEEAYPETNHQRSALVIPIQAYYLDRARPLLWVLLGGVGLLLAIACGNVANLQTVRAAERGHELSVRLALGAGRGRVVRLLVVESVLLAGAGAAAGLALAAVALPLLLELVPAGALPAYVRVELSPRLVLLAAAVALLAGVAVGWFASRRSARQPVAALRGARAAGDGPRPGRWSTQRLVVGGEVTLALVLLVAAGLAVRSLRRQLDVDPGFRAAGTLAARVGLTGERYDAAARRRFAQDLLETVRGLPGVDAVAVGSDGPLRGSASASLIARADRPDERLRYYRHSVSDGYFRTLGIPLLSGRAFGPGDGADAPGVVVVGAAFAARLWPGEPAVGKRLLVGDDTATVIGVAGDVHYRDLTTRLTDPGEDPDLYFSLRQITPRSFDVLLHGAGDPGSWTAGVRRAVSRLDPAIPLYRAEPLARTLAARTALGRLMSWLLALFALLSLLLAAVGLYGVMAYIVRGRRREMAVRSAVGARPGQLRAMVVRQGMAIVATGLAGGIAGAALVGRILAGLLYGVRAVDPAVLVVTATVLAAAALLATWLPALQATRIDPREALSRQ